MHIINWILSFDRMIVMAVIATIVYIITKWSSKNNHHTDNIKSRNMGIVMSLLMTPFIYIALVLALLFGDCFYYPSSFDAEEWQQNREERYLMSKDIISSRMLIGKTATEVEDILGNYDRKYTEFLHSYYIGHVPGLFNIDPDVLVIRYANGVVAEVRQHES